MVVVLLVSAVVVTDVCQRPVPERRNLAEGRCSRNVPERLLFAWPRAVATQPHGAVAWPRAVARARRPIRCPSPSPRGSLESVPRRPCAGPSTARRKSPSARAPRRTAWSLCTIHILIRSKHREPPSETRAQWHPPPFPRSRPREENLEKCLCF